MAKVKGSVSRDIMLGEELVEFDIIWSVDDDGYEVSTSGDHSINFGNGDLGLQLSYLLYEAIEEELLTSTDILPDHHQFEFELLNNIYSLEKDTLLQDKQSIHNMKRIMDYITHWL